MGECCQIAMSSSLRISASTVVMVPKNTGTRQPRTGYNDGGLTETLHLHDISLRANLLDELPLALRPPDRALRRRAAEDCANGFPARVLHDEEDAGEDNAE